MSIATLGDVQLTSEDVDTLDEWLNDQIIDFYFEHLSQRFSSTEEEAEEAKPSTSNGSSSSNPGVVFVGASASFLCAHGGASAVAGPLKLAKADLVFLPVNDNRNLNRAGGGSHWSLLVFDREGGEGGGGSNGAGAGAAEEEESTSVGGGEKKKGASAAAAVVENGKTTSSFPKGKTAAAKPVFRVYDSLGYKNMICAKELSSALEEHLILDEEEEEEEEEGNGTTTNPAADEAEERSRRQRQRRRLDVAASRTRSIAPTRVLNFVQGRCPRQGNASDCGIYILALAERIAAGRFKGLSYREIEEQLFREVTPSFAEEERERLRLLVEEVGKSNSSSGGDAKAAAKKKTAASKKTTTAAPKRKGG